ncbi:MAG: hypothetical protein H6815_13555 [Phycisphaeraceae bacterium]|nr:hypothetical protein [Phycisphaerales bacterium]MCB9861465.1 hypothetical protein [Phycisphaeraceae bacterium]
MGLHTEQTTAQSCQAHFVLYDRALHPEHFELQGRRSIRRKHYQMEAWLLQGGHAVRFEHGTLCATELVLDSSTQPPSKGILTNVPASGEFDHEHHFSGHGVLHLCSVQSEVMTPGLFVTERKHIRDFIEREDHLMCEWETPKGIDFSGLHFDKRANEIHIEAYHFRADGCQLIQTHSIFEHAI